MINNTEKLNHILHQWRDKGLTQALVPTMGALHEGHLSLIRIAKENSDRVSVSIFVNPTQFEPGEDLDRYPRNLQRDIALLEKAGADLVYSPENTEDIYPPGFETVVSIPGLASGLCGKYRPGHFAGVCTICTVLFQIFKPHVAVFGQKDAQQLILIKQLVKDLRLGVKILSAPIIREPDGLAMSSRNSYLSDCERRDAVALFRGLKKAAELVSKGERKAENFIEAVRKEAAGFPLVKFQYIELVDYNTLKPVEVVSGIILLAVAAYVGNTRLIDNIVIDPDKVSGGIEL